MALKPEEIAGKQAQGPMSPGKFEDHDPEEHHATTSPNPRNTPFCVRDRAPTNVRGPVRRYSTLQRISKKTLTITG